MIYLVEILCSNIVSRHYSSLHCSHKHHQATVNELQSKVAALRAEVAELRAALDAIHSSSDNSNAIASLMEEVQQLKAQPPREKEADTAWPWSQVVRRKGERAWEKGQVYGYH